MIDQNSASQWATLSVATFNMLNLALPDRMFYANQTPYSTQEYRRKVEWLGLQLSRLNADLIAVQEVWDETALRDAVANSHLHYSTVQAPGAEQGATGTPRNGLITRLPLEDIQAIQTFPAGMSVPIPELGEHSGFERPILKVRVHTRQGQVLHVLIAHLKSKRPKFLQDEEGNALEDRDDPRIAARAALRSLVMRAAEAVALRAMVVDIRKQAHEPLILMGDLNDGPHAVTTQMVAATAEVAYDRHARATALFNAYDIQTGAALLRDVAYSHVYQGFAEVLDQIFVSEEFMPDSRFNLGDVRRVDYFNDHLNEGHDRIRSDHGFVRALLRLRMKTESGLDLRHRSPA
ncbi:MAG: endonuclease/exonuclease/phosphatase family protein [Formivibrio sp.]|nr:endonuclease/exonuclease/phosphatase family protein [Formivibrio sp.]